MTDQTSAHDALGGYIPAETTFNDARILRETQPAEYEVRAILAFQAAGAIVFDYGNNLRAQAQETGVEKTATKAAESKPAITQTAAMNVSFTSATETSRNTARAGSGQCAKLWCHHDSAARRASSAKTRASSECGARRGGSARKVWWMARSSFSE